MKLEIALGFIEAGHEHAPSHILHPNGSAMAATDPDLCASLTRNALGLRLANQKETRCDHCGEATHYRRGTSAGGGTSMWVHTETGEHRCADGQGYADRPASYDREERP